VSTSNGQRAALCLLCLQQDKSDEYEYSIIETILKTRMKVTGPMALNRDLARFTTNSRKLNNQHAAPFAIEQKYDKEAWTLFLRTAWLSNALRRRLLDDLQPNGARPR
jgi:hypothetical protein